MPTNVDPEQLILTEDAYEGDIITIGGVMSRPSRHGPLKPIQYSFKKKKIVVTYNKFVHGDLNTKLRSMEIKRITSMLRY